MEKNPALNVISESTVSHEEANTFGQESIKQETKKQLDAIDDTTMKETIASIIRPAGAEHVLESYIPTKDVRVVFVEEEKDRNSTGFFNPKISTNEEPEIIINAARIAQLARDGVDISQLVVYVFAHEQVHNLSFDRKKFADYEASSDKWFIGFEEQERRLGRQGRERKHIEQNEAMTEILAEIIADEYIRRTGSSPSIARHAFREQTDERVYSQYKKELNHVADELAKQYAVSVDTIIRAMIIFFFAKSKLYNNFPDWLENHHHDLTAQGKLEKFLDW